MTRRLVRASPDFFASLDAQLGDERGSQDEPSSADLEAYELLSIIEEFATGRDDLPEHIPGRTEYRVLIKTGRVVPMVPWWVNWLPMVPSSSWI